MKLWQIAITTYCFINIILDFVAMQMKRLEMGEYTKMIDELSDNNKKLLIKNQTLKKENELLKVDKQLLMELVKEDE